jgi:hypothetical protein
VRVSTAYHPAHIAALERQPATYIPLLSPIAEHVVPVFEAALRDDR